MAVAPTTTMKTDIILSSFPLTLSISTSKGGQNRPSHRQEIVWAPVEKENCYDQKEG
jgi:hypothetical protein